MKNLTFIFAVDSKAVDTVEIPPLLRDIIYNKEDFSTFAMGTLKIGNHRIPYQIRLGTIPRGVAEELGWI